jgi:hypothetical protein
MTTTRPHLLRGPTLIEDDPTRAVAVLHLPPRELSWLGEVPDSWYRDGAGAVREAELAEQVSFAGRPYADAWAASRSLARRLLDRIAETFARSAGARFDPARLLATVRVDRRDRYRQLQGPHIDWTRTTEFHEDEWNGPVRDGQTLGSLARCHSIDCVLAGPPTEFFLAAQDAHVFLTRSGVDRPWTVGDVDFPERGRPQAGATATLVHRPPYTVHQFPSPDRWQGPGRVRLFVSCDYWTSTDM